MCSGETSQGHEGLRRGGALLNCGGGRELSWENCDLGTGVGSDML